MSSTMSKDARTADLAHASKDDATAGSLQADTGHGQSGVCNEQMARLTRASKAANPRGFGDGFIAECYDDDDEDVPEPHESDCDAPVGVVRPLHFNRP